MAKKLDKLTPRDVDFAKWYTDIVKNANLMEYGPAKGTMIFKPYGFAIWENIHKLLDAEFKELGVENVYFPLLIPESLFNKEKEHIAGFAPEVATVTKIGDKELDEPLFIRPTSEVLFADYFKNNIQSYRDLPLIFNQWVNVVRWEKTTRPFLRTNEFLWQEGHTVHASETEANDFAKKILGVYENFAKTNLLLPVIAGKKSIMERFAGAKETYTIESLMHDGQALQTGTSHYLGNNFTKAYEINFQNQEGKLENPYSTSWGVSTRMIGAIIMSHGDDSGLVLPSKIAPDQIRIIPVGKDELNDVVIKELLKHNEFQNEIANADTVTKVSKKIKNLLSGTVDSVKTALSNEQVNDINNEIAKQIVKMKNKLSKKYRVKVDTSNKTFGYKISEAEIQGVPIRIEIGMRDLENGVVTVSRRDNFEKVQVKILDLSDYIDQQIELHDQAIFNKALANRENRTYQANSYAEYKTLIDSTPGFVLVPFCGRVECEEVIKKETTTVSRCFPFDQQEVEMKCFHCGQDTKTKAYFGRAY